MNRCTKLISTKMNPAPRAAKVGDKAVATRHPPRVASFEHDGKQDGHDREQDRHQQDDGKHDLAGGERVTRAMSPPRSNRFRHL